MGAGIQKTDAGAPVYVGIVNPRIHAPRGGRSAYSYSPRSDEDIASDLRGSTLRTGYCDRKIDEDRLSEIESDTTSERQFH